MNILQAAILGLVQGLGEFLPISSSGHLLLSRILMGFTIDETGAYHMLDILLHVGTLIPVLIVFWKGDSEEPLQVQDTAAALHRFPADAAVQGCV